jgi:hypothetical protein
MCNPVLHCNQFSVVIVLPYYNGERTMVPNAVNFTTLSSKNQSHVGVNSLINLVTRLFHCMELHHAET